MDRRFEIEEAQAGFRGVPFHEKKRTRDGGRRGPTHEMPQRDEPDGEDLGRKVRVFKVEALVIGDDHVSRALRLIAALEDKAGPGIYRDPWHGEWSVICRSYSVIDDEDRQGVTAFSITFEESGDARYPLAALDTQAAVDRSAGNLSSASAVAFARRFSLAGRPQFVADHGRALVESALSDLVGADLPRLDRLAAIGIPDVASDLSGFSAGMPSSLKGDLGGSLADLFRSFGGGAYSRRGRLGDPASARMAFARMGGYGEDLPAVPTNTGTRKAQSVNQAALVALVRRLAIAEEARALAASSWDSFDVAMAERAGTLLRLSELMRGAGADGEDGVFSAAAELRTVVTRDVASRALPLPRLRRETMDEVLPARVVAHRLLGDGRLADDLVARNKIGHPAFTPAGVPLEVLDNGG